MTSIQMTLIGRLPWMPLTKGASARINLFSKRMIESNCSTELLMNRVKTEYSDTVLTCAGNTNTNEDNVMPLVLQQLSSRTTFDSDHKRDK